MRSEIAVLAILGLAYGAVLQRSGFCFAKIGYELFLLRRREALNGVVAGMAAATLGFAGVSALRAQAGLSPTSHLLLLDFGPGTVLGAALFGAGMTVAGMCAVGTLLRLGEGYVVAWITLLGFVIGAALDPFRAFLPAAWHTPHRAVWLGQSLGLLGAALLTVGALLAVWAVLNGKLSRRPRAEEVTERAAFLATPVAGGIALGLLNTVQTAVLQPWTASGPFALVPGALSGAVTPGLWRLLAPLLVVNVGVVLGAGLCRGCRERKWALRWPRRREQIVLSLLGGLAMAWGLQLAHGCSVGGAFSAVPSLSLSGWLFFPSLLAGTWLGAQVMKRVG